MKFSELSFVVFFALIPCMYAMDEEFVPGGIRNAPINDPEIVRLSELALLKLNKGKQGENAKKLVEIVEASQQIVAGLLTRLTLKISSGENVHTCKVQISEKPGSNEPEINFLDCEEVLELKNKKEKRSAIIEDEESKQVMLMQLFNNFIKKHKKVYANDNEYKKRYHIFRANINKIKFLRTYEQGTAQYGLTEFSDLSATEFKKYLGLKKPHHEDELPPAEIPNIKLPDHFDWRYYNIVTPVKDQKSCGSCWAFSVTGNVEGQWALKKGELLSLSEQELLDCDSSDDGCGGGYMTNAFKAIMKIGGLETESDYPYEAENEKCHFNSSEVKVKIDGAVNITSDEVKMAKWLVKNGPMSVALNANAMMYYLGGVSHPPKFLCNPQNLDHGVLIVGFGVHHSSILNRTLPYWLIKNSWGKRWGEKGYYRLYRGDGSCGIDQMVSSSIVN